MLIGPQFKNKFSSYSLEMIAAHGFSLIEVIVGITILAFLSLGIVQITEQSINSQERISQEDKEFIQVQMGLDILRDDLSKIYSPLYFSSKEKRKRLADGETASDIDGTTGTPDPNNPTDSAEQQRDDQLTASKYEDNARFAFANSQGHPVPIFEQPDKSSFIFLSSSNKRKYRNSKESSLQWIKYSLESSDRSINGKNVFNLQKQTLKQNIYAKDKIDWESVKSFTLMRNILELEFKFWDEKKEKFEALEFVKDAKNFIRGFEITLTWIDQYGNEYPERHVVRPWWPYFKEENAKKATTAPEAEN